MHAETILRTLPISASDHKKRLFAIQIKIECEDLKAKILLVNQTRWVERTIIYQPNIDLLTSKDIKSYKQSELGQKVTTKERIEEITNNLQGRKRECLIFIFSFVCFFKQKWFEEK